MDVQIHEFENWVMVESEQTRLSAYSSSDVRRQEFNRSLDRKRIQVLCCIDKRSVLININQNNSVMWLFESKISRDERIARPI